MFENDILEKIPADAKAIHNILKNKGFQAYFVGGALRDIVLNKIYCENYKIKDWDITTDARYKDMEQIFNKMLRVNFNGNIVNKKSTARILIPSLETTGVFMGRGVYEITPMKTYSNNKICFTDKIEEDLSKRDFTINTLAYSPGKELISQFMNSNDIKIDAIRDIKERVIRSTDTPMVAFERNYYNIVRAILFANRFDFEIEDETLLGMLKNIDGIRHINKGKLSIGFESLIIKGGYTKLEYLKTTKLLDNLSVYWNEYYSDEFIYLLQNCNFEDKDFGERLYVLIKKFSNKDVLVDLLKEFGVNKEILYKIYK